MLALNRGLPDRRLACLLAVLALLAPARARSQHEIATPGTSGDQLLFVYDATEQRVPFLVVSNLADAAVRIEVAWYAQALDRRHATQLMLLPGGGNAIFDPSRVDGVSGNAGLAVVTTVRRTGDPMPVVGPSPQGAGNGPLFGGFTLADRATGAGFGQNPLGRRAVDANGRRPAPGAVVDGSAVRYQTFAPGGLALPFYFDPSGDGLTNRVILATFEDQYGEDGFRIVPASTEYRYEVLDSAATPVHVVDSFTVAGLTFETVQGLGPPAGLVASGKMLFSDLSAGDDPNRNQFGLMTQALGTFSVGQRMPGLETAPRGRWTDNGDGTVTDNATGLDWGLLTGDGSIQDKDGQYRWSNGVTGAPDGGVFHIFLRELILGESADGRTTTGCFAGKCDWRLPTVEELQGLVDLNAFGCGTDPFAACTTIPGYTTAGPYWSSSSVSDDELKAWVVDFSDGTVHAQEKLESQFVRGVRGGP